MAAAQYVAIGAIVVALAVAAAVWKAWRMHAARRRLERMYAAAHHPSRCLVEVLGPLRSTRTGQLLLVIDVRSGQEATLWLPPQSLGQGDLALLVWMDRQWVLMDLLVARRLHRAVARRRQGVIGTSACSREQLDESCGVVREAERYLRS